jgi:hypothetical protein
MMHRGIYRRRDRELLLVGKSMERRMLGSRVLVKLWRGRLRVHVAWRRMDRLLLLLLVLRQLREALLLRIHGRLSSQIREEVLKAGFRHI